MNIASLDYIRDESNRSELEDQIERLRDLADRLQLLFNDIDANTLIEESEDKKTERAHEPEIDSGLQDLFDEFLIDVQGVHIDVSDLLNRAAKHSIQQALDVIPVNLKNQAKRQELSDLLAALEVPVELRAKPVLSVAQGRLAIAAGEFGSRREQAKAVNLIERGRRAAARVH